MSNRDYNLRVYEGGILIDEVWTGDNFNNGETAMDETVARINLLIALGEIQSHTTRIVLAQYDGTVEEELIV